MLDARSLADCRVDIKVAHDCGSNVWIGLTVTNGISLGRKTIGRVQLGDRFRVGDGHSGALTEVASRVAVALAKALRLASEVGSRPPVGGGASDPYEIDGIASQLSMQLGGSQADAATLARSLHEFAQESAALIGARPHSRSFAAIESAITKATGECGEARSVRDALVAIERTTSYVRSGV